MTHMLIRHKVQDFPRWKRVFEEMGEVRRSHGSLGGTLLRNTDNFNEVVLLLRWSDVEKARAFIRPETLARTMANAGILDTPDIVLLEEAMKTRV